MNEYIVKTIEKKLELESGEKIEIVIRTTNIKKNKGIKDFLETMFKEILSDYF